MAQPGLTPAANEELCEAAIGPVHPSKAGRHFGFRLKPKAMARLSGSGSRGISRRFRFARLVVDKAEVSLAGAGKPKRPPSKWILHVKAYREKHGGSYKDAMKAAKATYKK